MPKEALRLLLKGSVSALGLDLSDPICGIGNVTFGHVPKPESGGAVPQFSRVPGLSVY